MSFCSNETCYGIEMIVACSVLNVSKENGGDEEMNKWQRDAILMIRIEKVLEKSRTFYCRYNNFPLDRFQKTRSDIFESIKEIFIFKTSKHAIVEGGDFASSEISAEICYSPRDKLHLLKHSIFSIWLSLEFTERFLMIDFLLSVKHLGTRDPDDERQTLNHSVTFQCSTLGTWFRVFSFYKHIYQS